MKLCASLIYQRGRSKSRTGVVEWGVLRRWVLILENIEWSQGPKRKKGLIRESKGGSFRETSEGEVCSVETGALDSVLDGGE